MPVFTARCVGDVYFDDITADTMDAAAMLFAEQIRQDGEALTDEDDDTVIEIAAAGDWLTAKLYQASVAITVKVSVDPLEK